MSADCQRFHYARFPLHGPEAFVKLRQAVLSSKFSDGKATTSGYNHTYTDTQGIDIPALSTYPTDSDINGIAVLAYGEAESLFALLGVTAKDLFYESVAPPRLPSIRTRLHDDIDEVFCQDKSKLESGIDHHDDSNDASSDSEDSDYMGGGDYQLALDLLEDADDDLTPTQEQRLKDYRYASKGYVSYFSSI